MKNATNTLRLAVIFLICEWLRALRTFGRLRVNMALSSTLLMITSSSGEEFALGWDDWKTEQSNFQVSISDSLETLYTHLQNSTLTFSIYTTELKHSTHTFSIYTTELKHSTLTFSIYTTKLKHFCATILPWLATFYTSLQYSNLQYSNLQHSILLTWNILQLLATFYTSLQHSTLLTWNILH